MSYKYTYKLLIYTKYLNIIEYLLKKNLIKYSMIKINV